jgi:hypothetical protein
MTKAEDLLYDPVCFGHTESVRAQNYLAFKLRLDGIESVEAEEALEATYRDGISIEEWEAAARQTLQEGEQEEAA